MYGHWRSADYPDRVTVFKETRSKDGCALKNSAQHYQFCTILQRSPEMSLIFQKQTAWTFLTAIKTFCMRMPNVTSPEKPKQPCPNSVVKC
ncbi:hypothetical protein NPIL_312321 [Nephila pilipes]|uniref:Uncharacterized protein n=1 Tax=Nephila pilipes TaxID=299642 RepID=A0A8X6NPF6_NEPPI|nr:hypothetical protein NPIL_312321 [Nephila pilipes]